MAVPVTYKDSFSFDDFPLITLEFAAGDVGWIIVKFPAPPPRCLFADNCTSELFWCESVVCIVNFGAVPAPLEVKGRFLASGIFPFTIPLDCLLVIIPDCAYLYRMKASLAVFVKILLGTARAPTTVFDWNWIWLDLNVPPQFSKSLALVLV